MRTDWRVVALVFIVGIFAAWQFAKLALPLMEIAAYYQRDPKSLAFLVSIVGLVGAVFGVIAGYLVSGFGPRRSMLYALLAGAVISCLQALLPSLAGMIVLRVAEGMSHLAIVVAAPTLMAEAASDKDRPIAMGIWAMFFGIAFAIGAELFPTIISIAGLPGLFVFHGLGLAILAVILWPILPRVGSNKRKLNVISLHKQTYGTVRTLTPAAGFVFYTVTYLALLTFLPDALGRPDFSITLPLISLFGTLGAGFMARNIAPTKIAICAFVVTTIFAIVLASGYHWAAYVVFLAQGAVPGASFASIPYLNPDPEMRTRATGAIAQMGNIGTTSGPPIFAIFLATQGLSGFLGLLAAFSALGAIVLIILTRKLRNPVHTC